MITLMRPKSVSRPPALQNAENDVENALTIASKRLTILDTYYTIYVSHLFFIPDV